MGCQFALFDDPDLVVTGRIVLKEGPYGMSWIEKDEPVSSADNPLFFRCALCGKTTSSANPAERVHRAGCWHPYAGRGN